jgi:hypothetical protein
MLINTQLYHGSNVATNQTLITLCCENWQLKKLLTQEDEIDGSFLRALMVCIDVLMY